MNPQPTNPRPLADRPLAGDPRYDTFLGRGPDRIVHWEHWSNPDAESYLTGIDYYAHPRDCRLRLQELYPQLGLPVPADDTPRKRPTIGTAAEAAGAGEARTRWGETESASWDFGRAFTTVEQVFASSPLELAAARKIRGAPFDDVSSEEAIYAQAMARFAPGLAAGDPAPAGSGETAWFYNTLFMWPILTYGWELFLETCLDPEFDRLMDEFAEISRRVFRALARVPVHFVTCHDDIATTRGPVCSPDWLRRHIYPRYEEYWGLLKAGGKEVIFMADGCVDACVDDVMACGARGIISEPYTDYKAIARRYDHPFLAGEGDNLVLCRNNPAEIEAMVRSMVETGRMSGGYMLCIGNHIPWNVPGEAVKRYLDLAAALGWRTK
jgi:hypothetical protein